MRRNLPAEAEQYTAKNRLRRIWQKFVRIMACIVVFCTTYALILPAITQESDTKCGLSEHTHTDACYVRATTQTLICTVPEQAEHVHTDSCYLTVPEQIAHSHTDSCFSPVMGPLICTLEEQTGHAHEAQCFTPVLTCVLAENHTHAAECWIETPACTESEESGHVHGPECANTISTLVCTQAEGHIHGETCYEQQLSCTIPEIPGHTHGDECYAWEQVLTCTLEELETAIPAQQTLICTEPEVQVHVHSEECYLTETAEEAVLSCGMEEHSHSLICHSDPNADLESAAVWEKSVSAAELTGQWGHDVVAIARTQLGYRESSNNFMVLSDGVSTKGYSRYGAWYGDPYGDWCAMFASFCLKHADVDIPLHSNVNRWIEALSAEDVDLYRLQGSHVPEPGELIFFDWDGDGSSNHVGIVTEVTAGENGSIPTIATIEGNSGNRVREKTYGLDDATILGYGILPAQTTDPVEEVIALIDALPTVEEIEAKVAEFDAAGDTDGEEAYYTELTRQVSEAYSRYAVLSDEQKAQVTNAEKLMDLEFIWSAAAMELGKPYPIHHVNTYSYVTGDDQHTSGTVLFVNKPVSDFGFTWWKEVLVEWQDGYLRVQRILPADGVTSKSSHQASSTGFILLFHEGNPQGFPTDIMVGDYVIPDFFIHQTSTDSYAYNGRSYGNITFSRTPPDYDITSAPTTVLKYQEEGGNVAHTADFIDLNVYNYNYSVNDNWRTSTKYPGFQWPGGAYVHYDDDEDDGIVNGWPDAESTLNIGIPNLRLSRQYIDSISFGDSVVTNMEYASSKDQYDANKHSKALGATSVGKIYRYTAAQSTGKINWLWYDPNIPDSTTNRPVGWTLRTTGTEGKAIQFKMNDNTPITVDNISLKYLFPYDQAAGTDNTTNGVTKLNTQSVDGLFQVNPVSGLYYYNSHNNHAQYSDNKFTLYEEIITPNFILYPFGNFLPFNNINTETTQVSAFNNSGGMKKYVSGTIYELQKWMADEINDPKNSSKTDPFSIYGYSSRHQLGVMLSEYAESWYNEDNGATWNSLSSDGVLDDFFSGVEGPAGASPDFPAEKLNNMYNIDWDQPTDFFFGMDMSMNILMPKNALTGHDNGNNNEPWQVQDDGTFVRGGKPDGIPDYPMVFNFAGDDDVWVYIDGLLFLDLTGIHRHVGGTIDFETGMVYYFGLDTAIGDTTNNTANADYYYAETFEEIIRRSFSTSTEEQAKMQEMLNGLRPVLNADSSQRYFENNTSRPMMTFKDYTTHTFKFFYMERGSGSSVCRMNFNFPMLRQNAITVSKKNVPDDATIKAMGNPDYYFNIIKSDESGLFIQPGTPYTILDPYGNEVGTGTVDQYGIFTIKAGQSAVFNGIAENAGEYYVQELIKDEDYNLYGTNVKVNGGNLIGSPGAIVNWAGRSWYTESPSDAVNNVDETGPGGHKWHLYSAPFTDSSSSSTFFFEMQNGVATNKLGKLSICKVLNGSDTSRSFDMEVTLDGEKLPVGTRYTVGNEEKTVETAGIVTIGPGETATISNIISGTKFTVREVDSGDYTVSYDYIDAHESDTGEFSINDSVSGIIRAEGHVTVTVTNTEQGAQVQIPVTKTFAVQGPEDLSHSYTFDLTQVTDQTGETEVENGTRMTLSAEFDGNSFSNHFTVPYLKHQLTELPATFYYRIVENGELSDSLDNTQRFVAEVTVEADGGGIKATLVTIHGSETDSAGSADFVNTLVGDLSLEKIVQGGSESQATPFSFTIKLEPGTSGVDPTSKQYDATFYQQNGDVVPTKCTANENGEITLNGFMHGEKAVIHGIPVGTAWTITETTAEGFTVSTTVGETTGDGPMTTGTITPGTTKVVYTNTQTYVLPETGGTGIIPYTMAGWMLMLCSTAYLLYRHRKRRRGAA